MADSNIFSVRIVSIDYHMAPPIPDIDICHSSFQGGTVNEVPVIRIYGSTPAGQKTCLHIHRALPYLYVPFPDISLQPQQEVEAYTHAISLAIEKALKLKGNAASKRQHVHGCSLVRAKKFYGYHSSEELFVKIYLYHPQDVSRAANLFLGGAVLDKVLQPHESHIPFLLQFLVDYNLYGMGHVHLSKIKFRPPVPDVISSVKAAYYGQHGQAMEDFTCKFVDFQADSGGDVCLNPPLWISSTVPAGWIWQFSGEFKGSSDQRKRRSTCELEGDATIDEILNQQSKMYSSLSQTCSDVKMVQSLIPIWEEEYERTRMHETVILPLDPGKPPPLDFLRTLSLGLDFESKLMDLCNEAENFVYLSPLEEDVKFMQSITTIKGNLVDHVTPNNKDGEPLKLSMERNNFGASQGLSCQEDYHATDGEGNVLLIDEIQTSETVKTSDPKAADKEAMGLLRWFVSSQAAEDINSDNEGVCETILNPILPAMTLDKVLEKANMDFESESQQECQDILDSIEDFVDFKGRKESGSINDNNNPQASSEKMMPQVDGSGDDKCSTPCAGNMSGILVDSDKRTPFQHQESQNEVTSFTGERCPNESSQSSLPASVHLMVNDDLQPLSFNIADTCATDTELSKGANSLVRKRDDSCFDDPLNADKDLAEAGTLVGCSLRDLMRRKRSYKVESSEWETHRIKMVSIEDQHKADTFLCPKRLEFSSLENCGTDMKSFESFNLRPSLTQETEFHALCDPKPSCSNYSVYGKLPLLSRSENYLQAVTLEDKLFDSCERVDDIVGNGVNAGSENLSCRYSPQARMEKKESLGVLNSMKHGCAVSMDLFEDYHNKDFSATSMKPVIHDVTSCKSDPSVGPALLKDKDAVGFDILSTFPADQDIFVRDGRSGKNTTYVEYVPEMLSDSLEDTDAMSNIAIQFENCGGGLERDMGLTGRGSVVSTVANMKDVAGELTAMTFCKKPPMVEWVDARSENALILPPIPCRSSSMDEDSYEGASERPLEDLGGSREEMEIENKCFGTDDSNFHQEAAMGVPTHFQNDGSNLYMLTPAYSPPSADSVYRWLLHDERGISSTNFGVASMESSSLKGCSDSLFGVQGSLDDACIKSDPNYVPGSSVKPILDQLKNQNVGNQNVEMKIGNSQLTPLLQNEGNIVKVKACSHNSQDISQISGPDGKSKLTPLSQVGFRDPASVGGGQQLTSISIEILAESRGDLRSDPRYDAINVIALAIEDDNDSTPVVYVLLRSIESDQRNLDGISGCRVLVSSEERQLFVHFMKIICLFDPDILLGWDIQGGSLGFLAERASCLGIGLLNNISRTPSETEIATRCSENTEKDIPDNVLPDSVFADSIEDAIIDDEWGRTHASGVHVGGRIVLNIWRLMRGEIKVNMYTVEAVAEAVLRRKIPSIRDKVLTKWFLSGPGQARYKCIEYVLDRAKLNLEIINQLDMINRTSELARVFGIDFFSVLSRGSQYRVESMLLRLAHTQNYIAISPGNQQVASQPAMECLPLVMEPESGFYADPVVVLDFQSLYPSMIIAYNLCFCTCLGKVSPSKPSALGVSSFFPDPHVLRDLKNQILLTPNGVMYVPSKVRKGILPRLLEEILSTRIMVKQAMKKLSPSQKVLQRIFNARQLALKLIANVTYGYTAAGFSGRMPCAELADSIVQCGRRTLETAISFVNAHDKWKARVIYGDTDSMFVLLKGRTVKEAFRIGQEIASEITAMNPVPVTLKFEKVYHPCFLLTKKRYVGYSYESPDQLEPVFDAKGIETVRRDACGAVTKTMEQSLRLFFEDRDIFEVKAYLQRQWTRILSGRMSLQDFVFAKEVRLGTYSTRTTSSVPPAAIVATKAMRADPRAEPRYGERIPYIVIHGEPGARLVDMVVDPLDLLAIESPFRLNDLYYINKQIIPALQRVFGLVGADLNKWFLEMPRPVREAFGKRQYYAPNPHRARIDFYYLSKHCLLCGELVQASSHFCHKCSEKKTALTTAVIGRTSKLERDIQHLAAICRHCGGGDWVIESGVKCTSLACSVFYEKRKVQKELQGLSAVATEAGFYPKCTVEWF